MSIRTPTAFLKLSSRKTFFIFDSTAITRFAINAITTACNTHTITVVKLSAKQYPMYFLELLIGISINKITV